MNYKPEQIQVQWPKFQMKNVECRPVKRDDQVYRLQNSADYIADSVLNGAGERADGDNLIVPQANLFNVKGSGDFSAYPGCPRPGKGYPARHRSKQHRVSL